MQKGTVGDDLWASCQLAEKELEAELLEVVGEANTFHPGWGQFIFGSAGEILGHDRVKGLLETIDRRHQETEARYGKVVPNSDTSPVTSSAPSSPAKLAVPSSPPNGSASLSDNESIASSGSPGTKKSAGKKGKRRK